MVKRGADAAFFSSVDVKGELCKDDRTGDSDALKSGLFFPGDGLAPAGTEDKGILYGKSRVLKPWGRESLSCILPVSGFSLAVTLGCDKDWKPEILLDKVF